MIQVIKRALDILKFVGRNKEIPSTLTDIAAFAGLNQGTCANIVKTLVQENFLEHVGRKKGYRLGPAAYSLTDNLSYNQNLLLAVKEPMEKLTADLNETSILGILRNHKRFIAHSVNCNQNLQVRYTRERNIYETATGRVLMAFLPEKERENMVQNIGLPDKDTWSEIKNKSDLDKQLEKIRKEKLAITFSNEHIVGLAVPIFNQETVVASLSVFLPESRYAAEHKKKIITGLQKAASAINKKLDEE